MSSDTLLTKLDLIFQFKTSPARRAKCEITLILILTVLLKLRKLFEVS